MLGAKLKKIKYDNEIDYTWYLIERYFKMDPDKALRTFPG
jgi:hypothetical protein